MKKLLGILLLWGCYACCKMDRAVIVEMVHKPSHFETFIEYNPQSKRNEVHNKYVLESFGMRYLGYCYDPEEKGTGRMLVRSESVSETFYYTHKKGDTIYLNNNEATSW